MNTSTAAIQAGVSVDTIRYWCRYGAIEATKQAGRWVIDTASLAYRIALGARRTKPAKVEYTVETMTAIGGNRWTKAGKDRIYLDWERFAPLEIDYYKTGNISGAEWDGEHIANRQAGLLLGSIRKVYFDVTTGALHCQYGYSESRVATREEVWETVVAGIRTAISAL